MCVQKPLFYKGGFLFFRWVVKKHMPQFCPHNFSYANFEY